jgi:hypothetical protein
MQERPALARPCTQERWGRATWNIRNMILAWIEKKHIFEYLSDDETPHLLRFSYNFHYYKFNSSTNSSTSADNRWLCMLVSSDNVLSWNIRFLDKEIFFRFVYLWLQGWNHKNCATFFKKSSLHPRNTCHCTNQIPKQDGAILHGLSLAWICGTYYLGLGLNVEFMFGLAFIVRHLLHLWAFP